MNTIGKLIYKNSWGYEVYVAAMRDISSSRVSYEFYTFSPDGEMSDIVTLQRKDAIVKKNAYDFLFNFSGDFARDDIDRIKNIMRDFISKENCQGTVQVKATMHELYQAVSEYIIENAESLSDSVQPEMFIKDGYGYMRTPCMDNFVKENKELGFKRIEILKRLKIMGVLLPSADRPFDVLVSLDNKKLRYYKIKLPEKKDNTEEAGEDNGEQVEVITV